MRRKLSTILTDCKGYVAAILPHFGWLQLLDGARNPEQSLRHVEEIRSGLRLLIREMDLLAAKLQAQIAAKGQP